MEKQPTKIQTFIFLDLESTGLPSPGCTPRITEISLVAVHQTNLLEPAYENEPRVIDKLTVCICPRKSIDPVASALTGLYNDHLEFQKDMDANVFDMIVLFVQHHHGPVCLISHNGMKFDFPLLRSELASIGKALPDDILCADSLIMFREIDEITPSSTCRRVLFTPGIPSENSQNGTSSRTDQPPCDPPQLVKRRSRSRSDENEKKNEALLKNGKSSDVNNTQNKQRFHPIKRKLDYNDIVEETSDFNGNDIPQLMNHDFGSPIGPPLLSDPLVSSSQGEDNIPADTDNSPKWEIISSNGRTDLNNKFPRLQEPEKMCSNKQLPMSESPLPEKAGCSSWESNGDKIQSRSSAEVKSTSAFPHGQSPPVSPSTLVEQTASYWDLYVSPDDATDAEMLTATCVQMSHSQCSLPDPVLTETNLIEPNSQAPSNDSSIQPHVEVAPSVAATSSTSTKTKTPISFLPPELEKLGTHAPKKMKPFQTVFRPGFKLDDLHRKFLLKEPPQSHRAEADCMKLLRLFHKTASQTLPWVNTNAVAFNSIDYMYKPKLRTPLKQGVFPHIA